MNSKRRAIGRPVDGLVVCPVAATCPEADGCPHSIPHNYEDGDAGCDCPFGDCPTCVTHNKRQVCSHADGRTGAAPSGTFRSRCLADLVYTLRNVEGFISNAIYYTNQGYLFAAGRAVEKASRLLDSLNTLNVPHQARRDSGVTLDGIVGRQKQEEA